MIIPVIDMKKAELMCGAIRRKKWPQAIFVDANVCGFRIKQADKLHGNELFLDSFLMVADSTITASDICSEWNLKVISMEGAA